MDFIIKSTNYSPQEPQIEYNQSIWRNFANIKAVTCLVVDCCKRQNSYFSSSSSSGPRPTGHRFGMGPTVGIGPVPGLTMHVNVRHEQGVVVGFDGPKLMVTRGKTLSSYSSMTVIFLRTKNHLRKP